MKTDGGSTVAIAESEYTDMHIYTLLDLIKACRSSVETCWKTLTSAEYSQQKKNLNPGRLIYKCKYDREQETKQFWLGSICI